MLHRLKHPSLEFYYTLRGAQTGSESDFKKAGEIDSRFDREKIDIYTSGKKPHYLLDTRGTYYLNFYKYKRHKGYKSTRLLVKAFNFFTEAKKISQGQLDEDIYARYFETIKLLEEENLLGTVDSVPVD